MNGEFRSPRGAGANHARKRRAPESWALRNQPGRPAIRALRCTQFSRQFHRLRHGLPLSQYTTDSENWHVVRRTSHPLVVFAFALLDFGFTGEDPGSIRLGHLHVGRSAV